MSDLVLQFIQSFKDKAPLFAGSVSLFLIFYFAAIIGRRILVKLGEQAGSDQSKIFDLAGSVLKSGIILMGLISALGTLGVDVSAMVAGLGLTGFALGFALKDALSNLLAGVLVLFYQPFKIGDRVEVSGCKGIVKDIDLRYTTLESEDTTFLIPNSTCFKNWIALTKSDP